MDARLSARAGLRAGPRAGLLACAVAALSIVASGCTATAAAPSSPAASTVAAPPSPAAPLASELHYPDGASASTPECQPASTAVVDAVNAAMTVPDYHPEGEPFAVSALVASPDPENAVWLLTGTIRQAASTEGQLVVWATTSVPTQDAFTGTLRSIGGQTAQISSAPSLQFANAEAAGGLPTAALRCAAGGGS